MDCKACVLYVLRTNVGTESAHVIHPVTLYTRTFPRGLDGTNRWLEVGGV